MRLLTSIGIVVLVIVSCCYGQGSDTTVGATPENLAAVSQSVTNLAQKISLAIASPKSKTEIFSPVSIAGALSLLLLGSGGATRDELMQVMGFQGSRLSFTDIHKSFGRLFQDLVSNEAQNVSIPWRDNDKCNNYDYDEEDDYTPPKPTNQRGKRDADQTTPFDRYSHEIQLANGVFLDSSFQLSSTYEMVAKKWYLAEVNKLEFSKQPDDATNHINSWVSRNTHGKIPEIFSSALGSNTVMVIASALYFKALWEQMFIEGATKPRDFYPNGRNYSAIKVDMMAHGGCFPYYESPELDARILGIPYKNNQTTMYVIKPNNSNRKVLLELIANLKADVLDDMIDKMRQKTAVVLFPKMHVSSTLNLKKTLKQLNVRSIFTASKSNLSAISGDAYAPRPTVNLEGNMIPPMANDFSLVRPAVNLPIRVTKKPFHHNDLTDKLIVSRYQNESTPEAANPEPMTTETPTPAATTVEPVAEEEPSTTTPGSAEQEQPPAVKQKQKRDVSYKVPSEVKNKPEPLTSKDFFSKKRIVKTTPGKKTHRTRRQAQALYVSDAIHKVDLEINERGTEGGAATAISLNRSGTSAVMRADEPFLIVIRNDNTKLPLFFGAVYDPSP